MELAGGTRHGARRGRRRNEQWASRSSGRKEEATGWTWKSSDVWIPTGIISHAGNYWRTIGILLGRLQRFLLDGHGVIEWESLGVEEAIQGMDDDGGDDGG